MKQMYAPHFGHGMPEDTPTEDDWDDIVSADEVIVEHPRPHLLAEEPDDDE
jgi:hypothetical protein